MMDLARLLIAFCPSYSEDRVLKQRFCDAMANAASAYDPWEMPLPKGRETNMLFLYRALANTFHESEEIDVPFVHRVSRVLYGNVPLSHLTAVRSSMGLARRHMAIYPRRYVLQ